MESQRGQAGFSLVELLTAIVVTMVVTGAVFGLLTSGNAAFRNQPEHTDRQQNIRLAMALIEQDVGRGGSKMGAFSQVFTDGLDGLGPQGLASRSDFLEIAGNDGECPDVAVCGINGNNVTTAFEYPSCYPDPGMVLLTYPDGSSKWGFAWNLHGQNAQLNFPAGQQPPTSQIQESPRDLCNPPSPGCGGGGGGGCGTSTTLPVRVSVLEIVRYEIAMADGAPNLYRSERGGITNAGAQVPAPDPAGQWQLVARGIEDLQVRYQKGPDPTIAASWADTPGPVAAPNPDTVVRRAQVTLSARSMTANLQGQTDNANLGSAVRGQLVSAISPRAALLGIQGTLPNQWR